MGHKFSFCEGCETRLSCDNCIKLMDGSVQEINGETSDGYHTFNELYHHRAVLFSVICNAAPELAWKSKLHDTGDMYDGMFIVGIETPEGQATYHYDIDPYWDMFHVKELERAPKWDGHTPTQAIERISKLSLGVDCLVISNFDYPEDEDIQKAIRSGEIVIPVDNGKVEFIPMVRHGKWRFCGSDRWNDAYQCSACGIIAMDDSPYCPACGALMEMERNNE